MRERRMRMEGNRKGGRGGGGIFDCGQSMGWLPGFLVFQVHALMGFL